MVFCIISMITGLISAYIASGFSWGPWYLPTTIYETVFFISVLVFIFGLLLVVGIPQTIIKWINDGK